MLHCYISLSLKEVLGFCSRRREQGEPHLGLEMEAMPVCLWLGSYVTEALQEPDTFSNNLWLVGLGSWTT